MEGRRAWWAKPCVSKQALHPRLGYSERGTRSSLSRADDASSRDANLALRYLPENFLHFPCYLLRRTPQKESERTSKLNQNQIMKTKSQLLLAGLVLCLVHSAWAQPVITQQPQNQTNVAGTTAMFTVAATGAGPLSYQWRSHANATSFTNIPFRHGGHARAD